jgi:hypothetical protein
VACIETTRCEIGIMSPYYATEKYRLDEGQVTGRAAIVFG